MKTFRSHLLPLALSYLLFGGFLYSTAQDLPDQVATHFGVDGRPNDWMPRASYLGFIALFGAFFPGFIAAVASLSRVLPDSMINLPNQGYWLSPPRRRETLDYLTCQSLSLGIVAVGFAAGIHWCVIRANQLTPAHLDVRSLLLIAGGFVAAVVTFTLRLLWHFRRPE